MCLPHFDGDPVFGRLVAGDAGGRFRLGPVDGAVLVGRRYRPGSAVLETAWECSGARLILTEGMIADVRGRLLPTSCLVRRLHARRGAVRVELCVDPRFGHHRGPPTDTRHGNGVLVCSVGSTALSVVVDRDVPVPLGRSVEIEVSPDRPLTVVLTAAHRGPLTHLGSAAAWQALLDDEVGWRRWSSSIAFDGPRRDPVVRSLITLRLLTYSPSGAPVAAPTTSLPEELGGGRNWDYRYAWPRDASIGIGAFLGVGLVDQARAFLYWLLHASRLDRPRLRPLLTIQGRSVPAEEEVAWPGYAGSRPVRLGNGARDQHQLDTYGWVLDAMWLLEHAGHRLFGETWRTAVGIADHVARGWHEPDAGIWEVRGDPAHYVHSKLMAWLAIDRALRIAETHRLPARRRATWEAARRAIAADVVARGFDPARSTFTRAYGRTDVDAALLVLPILGVEPRDSPRVLGTIDAVRSDLTAGGPLLYRYPPGDDHLAGGEGAFLPCSFWLAQALAASGRCGDAEALFDELLPLGGPLGLFAEEADPQTGEFLGNYPQALTHAALVQAALAIRDAKDPSG